MYRQSGQVRFDSWLSFHLADGGHGDYAIDTFSKQGASHA